MLRLLLIILMCCKWVDAISQGVLVSPTDLSMQWLRRQEIAQAKVFNAVHLSQQPVSRKQLAEAATAAVVEDSVQEANRIYVLTDNYEWTDTALAVSRKPFLRYFYHFRPAFYAHYSDDFFVQVSPLFCFNVGGETADNGLLFRNVRGIRLRGWVARKVGFDLNVSENQLFAPQYVRHWIAQYDAVPFHGYYKEFKDEGVDFLDASGHISFTAARFIGIQFGHGKQFYGNGLRSLALSDFSNDYLFLRLQTQVWRISYQNLFMDLTANFQRGADRLLEPKYAAMHHLSCNITSFANIGLWESVVFHRNNGFELHYLNPLIFYRAIEQGLGSPDNTMLGLDFRINLLKAVQWYGQLVLDDFNFQYSRGNRGYWGNKYGLQQGLRWINVGGVRNLDVQVEWNWIRPYTYSHADSLASHTHYNAPLAHPLGANLKEWIVRTQYQPLFPLRISASWLLVQQGRDSSATNWGSNIFYPTTLFNIMQEFGNRVGQGVPYRMHLLELSVSWLLKHNFFLDASVTYRKQTAGTPAESSPSLIYQLGVRLNYDSDVWWF